MRTWFAHQYLDMDRDVIWEVMHEGIPPLKAFCEVCLQEEYKPNILAAFQKYLREKGLDNRRIAHYNGINFTETG